MSYTQLPIKKIIKIASEFVGLGYPIPQEIVAHLGPRIINLIEHPGENDDTRNTQDCGLHKSSPVGETVKGTEAD